MISIARSIAELAQKFLNKLFAKFRSSNPPVSLKVVEKKEPRKPRNIDKYKSKTFSELLDNLEYTFDSVKLPAMNCSWIERDSIVGLKKLGVHIPNPWVMLDVDDAKVDTTKELPSIMCLSASTANTVDEKDKHYPKILFAIKLKKFPWYVERKLGTLYQFGAAFELKGKLLWINVYMTVSKSTGEIRFCDELQVKPHTVNREKTFYTKSWSTSSYFDSDIITVADHERMVKNMFVSMHEWWSERDNRWNVVVKKNGDRVTFGVDNSETPYYFKDRDKSIKTASGQTKKIVHYVKEHNRKVNDKTITVKEHIRGLQEFNWASYQCKVISPKLQVKTSATFTAPSEYGDLDDENSNVIYLSKVGKLLADAEENNYKPKEKQA
jgi:hypothetical protein